MLCSAKSGLGIDDILRMVCKIIPSPNDRRKEPLRYTTPPPLSLSILRRLVVDWIAPLIAVWWI